MDTLLSDIGRLDGVNGGLITDQNGTALFKSIEAGNQLSRSIAACANTFLSISARQFKYAVFSRKNNTQVLIFPFGSNYFLAVFRHAAGRHQETDLIAGRIIAMLAQSKTQ